MRGDHSAKDRWFPDKKSRGAPQQWTNLFDSLPPHTEVVICLLGCEGVGVDIDHWKIFWARLGQTHQRKIILMIGETENDWDRALFPWDPKDWSRKIMERHWAIFDIEKLVEKDGGVLLHQTLLKI